MRKRCAASTSLVRPHLTVVYASVLRNKMTCAMKLDYSEEEVRSVNLACSSSSHPSSYNLI